MPNETSASPAQTIGFIGLGIMGSRMAANLQQRGFRLIVHNRSRAKAADLLAAGAEWADSPAAVAARADLVLTMLAHPSAVEETALASQGLLAQPRAGLLWLDCSTVNPSFARKMSAAATARGVRFLEAPVTGSKPVAAQAKLIVWAGGAVADLDTARPALEAVSARIVHCGEVGMGASMKIVINQILGTFTAAFAEGLVLGEGLGLSRNVLLETLLNSPVAAPFLAGKRERIEKGDFGQADFPLRWLQKDLHLATLSAYENGVAMPLTNAAKETYQLAVRAGLGDLDFSAVHEFLAKHRDTQP